VIVDSVSEALDVQPDQLERRPAFGAGLRADFVAGMLNLAGRFVVVLDVNQVLSMSELELLVTDAALGRPSARTRAAPSEHRPL
jgi:purine-binding chemotaxis protein CheW